MFANKELIYTNMLIKSLKPNKGKKLEITVDGEKYFRYPIKTHVVSGRDNICDVVNRYVGAYIVEGDMVIISERVVAITQGRAIPIDKIKPSIWAKLLVKFVYKPSWGIGIGSPWTMQVAIDEAGLGRILLAGTIGTLGKLVGVRGLFYKMVGSGVNAIDGPTPYTLPPGNKCATLGPKNPDKVAKEINESLKKLKSLKSLSTVIIDANDIGRRIEGTSEGVDRDWACEVFSDNPLGQASEQTPMAIVRKVERERGGKVER